MADPRRAGDDSPPGVVPGIEDNPQHDRRQHQPADGHEHDPREGNHRSVSEQTQSHDHEDDRHQQDPEHQRWPARPSSLPAPDPERYGPVAPVPRWERPFNREKFLLWFLAGAVAAQYLFLVFGSVVCWQQYYYRTDRKLPALTAEQNVGCLSISERLNRVFELSISTVLALLGGASLARGGLSNGPVLRPRDDDPRRQ